MRQADLGNKRSYISDDSRGYSRNLRGPKEALKQASHEAMRISWIVVLARGRMAIEMLPEDWALNGDGMAHVVASLPGVFRRMHGRNPLHSVAGGGVEVKAGMWWRPLRISPPRWRRA